MVFSDEDFGGIWSIDHVYLSDTPGNTKTYRRDELDALGTKNIVNVIDGSVAVGDLLLDANSPQATHIPRAPQPLVKRVQRSAANPLKSQIPTSKVMIFG